MTTIQSNQSEQVLPNDQNAEPSQLASGIGLISGIIGAGVGVYSTGALFSYALIMLPVFFICKFILKKFSFQNVQQLSILFSYYTYMVLSTLLFLILASETGIENPLVFYSHLAAFIFIGVPALVLFFLNKNKTGLVLLGIFSIIRLTSYTYVFDFDLLGTPLHKAAVAHIAFTIFVLFTMMGTLKGNLENDIHQPN